MDSSKPTTALEELDRLNKLSTAELVHLQFQLNELINIGREEVEDLGYKPIVIQAALNSRPALERLSEERRYLLRLQDSAQHPTLQHFLPFCLAECENLLAALFMGAPQLQMNLASIEASTIQHADPYWEP